MEVSFYSQSHGSFSLITDLFPLINVVANLLDKALAKHLFHPLMHMNKLDFKKRRQLFYNVHTLLNIIHSQLSTVQPEIGILANAERAFDGTEWNYLFTVLPKFGIVSLGNKFIS